MADCINTRGWFCIIYRLQALSTSQFQEILMFQMKEKSAGKQKIPSKPEFTQTNDGPVVESLLKMILTKTNGNYRGFCEGLDRAGQGFIVKQCLSKQGKKHI